VEEHPNVELFRRTYRAFTSGDFDALGEVFAEDTVWHNPGRNLISGDFVGREAAFAAFAKEFELSGGTYSPTIHDVVANDEHIIALMHATAEREGKKLDMDYALIFHVKAGRLTEGWDLWTDQAAVDEFWS
jgi:ketosteroid isomerase-like protein